MPNTDYLALDLGAESGRLIRGSLNDRKLRLDELHRFQNVPLRCGPSLHWNFENLLHEVKHGLTRAASSGAKFSSISTDSWGVDYVLFDQQGAVMDPVYHYRDLRCKAGAERALGKVPWEVIFQETGIQYMPINTLFQLASEPPSRLAEAELLLGIGDAINHFLCGSRALEVSMASTFQLYNPIQRAWSPRLTKALELPPALLPEIVASGTRLGALRRELALETGLENLTVIASCSHDTGAAVAGVPAEGSGWAYLSSGTWSLMGVELAAPIITERARELNFTNEIGFGNSVRLLKNLSGLWLLQQCRAEWKKSGKDFDYATLAKMAASAPEYVSIINPAAEDFLAPESMPRAIAEFCRRTDQPIPSSEGAYIRCAVESLALLYRKTLLELEALTGTRIDRLHVVGGGSRNDLLNQLTADVLQIPVFAGPAEATAAGNVLIQAIAQGHLPSLSAARQIVRNSTEIHVFKPHGKGDWERAFTRFQQIARS